MSITFKELRELLMQTVREREDYNGKHQFAVMRIDDLRAALEGLLDRYTSLVNCGDCGFWDPEKESEVIAAREALARLV